MPRKLQAKIHSEFSTDPLVWFDYQPQVEAMILASVRGHDINDHLVREYNRKIDTLLPPENQGMKITPYDAGFRYVGDV